MRIYIAGPYSAPTEAACLDNVHAAIDAGLALIEMGHDPFIPHLTHWVEKRAERAHGGKLPYEFYLSYDRVWLAQCEAVLYLAYSPGADRERAHAAALGLPIYTALADVPSPDPIPGNGAP